MRNGERVRVTEYRPDFPALDRRSTQPVFAGVFLTAPPGALCAPLFNGAAKPPGRCCWHAPSGIYICSNGSKPHELDIVRRSPEGEGG